MMSGKELIELICDQLKKADAKRISIDEPEG